MHSRILDRHDGPAVNCLTGSYAVLTGRLGRPVPEQAIFERGDGFLFQAGRDERGFPEYIFPVEEAGARGMERSGFTVHAEPIDPDRIAARLGELLAARTAVVVWVNTAHLGYAEVYRKNAPYLHAVVIDAVGADHVRVHDSLVVDARPFRCDAELSLSDLLGATGDRIRSEAHDGMGFFYTATDRGAPEPGGPSFADQAARYFAEPRFRDAIRRYRDANLAVLADPATATHAARRLFHHASVLYAVPSLRLMGHALDAAGAAEPVRDLHAAAVKHWEAMGVLALRHEATGAASVLARIERRFDQLDEATTALWAALCAGSPAREAPHGVEVNG